MANRLKLNPVRCDEWLKDDHSKVIILLVRTVRHKTNKKFPRTNSKI